jgi:hypothetical protein
VGTFIIRDLTGSQNRFAIDTLGNVGIPSSSTSFKLNVGGAFNANSVRVNDVFTLPTTDGTSGQVMKTDGAGALTWQNDSGKIYFAGSGLN